LERGEEGNENGGRRGEEHGVIGAQEGEAVGKVRAAAPSSVDSLTEDGEFRKFFSNRRDRGDRGQELLEGMEEEGDSEVAVDDNGDGARSGDEGGE